MSIIRAPRPEGNFYVLNKAISEDARLTWAARGLLVYLLGKPDHWKISPTHLRGETAATIKPTGRDGIYGLLDELIKAGYVRRMQPRSEGGVLGEVSYLVSESPLPDSPYPAGPHPAGPHTAKPTLVSTDDKQVLKEPVSTEQSVGTDVPAQAAGVKAKGNSRSASFDPLTAKPQNVSAEAWAGFCEMRSRKGKGKELTKRACDLIAKKLKDRPNADAIVDLSTTNGWSDVFPESRSLQAGAGRPSNFTGLPTHSEADYQGGNQW